MAYNRGNNASKSGGAFPTYKRGGHQALPVGKAPRTNLPAMGGSGGNIVKAAAGGSMKPAGGSREAGAFGFGTTNYGPRGFTLQQKKQIHDRQVKKFQTAAKNI